MYCNNTEKVARRRPAPEPDGNQWLTVSEFSSWHGVGNGFVDSLITRGLIISKKIDGMRFFLADQKIPEPRFYQRKPESPSKSTLFNLFI